jgi:hypothetical protein
LLKFRPNQRTGGTAQVGLRKKKSDGYTCKKATTLKYRRPITMNESIIISEGNKAYFSSRASLAALGRKVKQNKVFESIGQKV